MELLAIVIDARFVLIAIAVVCELLAGFVVSAPKSRPLNWMCLGFAFALAALLA